MTTYYKKIYNILFYSVKPQHENAFGILQIVTKPNTKLQINIYCSNCSTYTASPTATVAPTVRTPKCTPMHGLSPSTTVR